MTFNPPTTSEGRWVIEFFAPWLDPKHPNPAMPGELRWFTTIAGKDQELPDDRPFVLIDGKPRVRLRRRRAQARGDHPPEVAHLHPGARDRQPPLHEDGLHVDTLQSLPEPLRSQMLYGDFNAGVQDDPWQVIPTAWVEAAMARWKRPRQAARDDSLGVDVARGGADETVIARRHEPMWFDEPIALPGKQTPDGAERSPARCSPPSATTRPSTSM
jgi:hypothetical protein